MASPLLRTLVSPLALVAALAVWVGAPQQALAGGRDFQLGITTATSDGDVKQLPDTFRIEGIRADTGKGVSGGLRFVTSVRRDLNKKQIVVTFEAPQGRLERRFNDKVLIRTPQNDALTFSIDQNGSWDANGKLHTQQLTAWLQDRLRQPVAAPSTSTGVVVAGPGAPKEAAPSEATPSEAAPKTLYDETARVVSVPYRGIEAKLGARVIGQPSAVHQVSSALERRQARDIEVAAENTRNGVETKRKPDTFLFVGPTGVGKTELAKAVANDFFGSEGALVRIDMSEYKEKHNVARLIGSPPGYKGSEDPGALANAAKAHPDGGVLLLDELEKAHSDVFDLLLPLIDEGHVTNGQNTIVKLGNWVIIATTNLAPEAWDAKVGEARQRIGFAASAEPAAGPTRPKTETELRNILVSAGMRKEFVGRWGSVVAFNHLAPDVVEKIAARHLNEARKTLARDYRVTLESKPGVVQALAKGGYSETYGVRPLLREIEKRVEQPVVNHIVTGRVGTGSKVHAELGKFGNVRIRRDPTAIKDDWANRKLNREAFVQASAPQPKPGHLYRTT